MTRPATLASLAVVAVIAGCGSAASKRVTAAAIRGGPNPAAAYPGGPAVVRLSEAEYTITPGTPKVRGTHVVDFQVTNNGSVTHEIAVRTPFGVLKSEPIPPGQQGGLTVDLMGPGTYAFYCPLHNHRLKGMAGTLVIASH